MHGHPIKDKGRFSSSGNCTGPKDSLTKCCLEHTKNFWCSTRLFDVACCSVRCAKRIRSTATCNLSISSLAQASFDIRPCQVLLTVLCCDWFAMSSYVFQFFCGPEGIALANPGAARARPALAGPPQRPAAELVFTELFLFLGKKVRNLRRIRSVFCSSLRPWMLNSIGGSMTPLMSNCSSSFRLLIWSFKPGKLFVQAVNENSRTP